MNYFVVELIQLEAGLIMVEQTGNVRYEKSILVRLQLEQCWPVPPVPVLGFAGTGREVPVRFQRNRRVWNRGRSDVAAM